MWKHCYQLTDLGDIRVEEDSPLAADGTDLLDRLEHSNFVIDHHLEYTQTGKREYYGSYRVPRKINRFR